MKQFIKNIYQKILKTSFEQQKIIYFMRKYVNPSGSVLDIGCGYGRNLKLFSDAGYRVIGVEKNKQIVENNKKKGLNCICVDEFNKISQEFDAIIMSHVIEHISPDNLKDFIDFYLNYLKPNGHLIIATPLLTSYFYDDFDHFKPYQPVGINMVFSGSDSQVQYYSKNRIKIIDIWFRKGYFQIHFAKGLYVKNYSRWPYLFNFLMAIIFRYSGGRIGRVDGWIGVYQKK